VWDVWFCKNGRSFFVMCDIDVCWWKKCSMIILKILVLCDSGVLKKRMMDFRTIVDWESVTLRMLITMNSEKFLIGLCFVKAKMNHRWGLKKNTTYRDDKLLLNFDGKLTLPFVLKWEYVS